MTSADSAPSEPSALEARIAKIWTSVLGVEDVAPDDDFFILGGSSISALSVISGIRREFGVRVPLAILFQTPTVVALADAVASLQGDPEIQAPEDRVIVRLAQEADFEAVAELVNRYIETSSYNFRTEPQAAAEWIDEWSQSREFYPWLVAERGGSIVGIAYAGGWKARGAYTWCAEVTTYVATECRRGGIGRRLFERLLELLDLQGYTTQIAVIALPNDPSVAFQEAFGFQPAGILRGVGYKHERWWDVGFWQRETRRADQPPPAVLRVADVVD